MYLLPGVIAATKIIDEHLFYGLVVGHQNVADGVSADEVADFFGKILGVVSGPLQRLRHEDNLQAGLAVDILGVLNVAQEDEIAQAIHFGVSPQDVDRFTDLALGKCRAAIGQHFFQDGRHLRQVAGVLCVDSAASRLCAVGETEQQVADTFQSDHELHAGEKFARVAGLHLGDGAGDAGIDFHVERIKFALALAQRIQQRGRSGGDPFGSGPCGFFGEVTRLDSAPNKIVMGRFRSGSLRRCAAHNDFRLARTLAADRLGKVRGKIRPIVGWGGHRHKGTRFLWETWLKTRECLDIFQLRLRPRPNFSPRFKTEHHNGEVSRAR